MRLSFPDQEVNAGRVLPNYGAPPVVETSIGIQFDGLTKYTSIAAADFWQAIKGDFPDIEEQKPLDPAFETFGSNDTQISVPKIQFIDGAIQPRFFFIGNGGSELVQLQKDRLFFNWRRTAAGEVYPRYPHVRKRLNDQLDQLYAWARRNALGDVIPTQCEAVYVNRISLIDSDGKPCGLSHVFPWFEGLKGLTEDGSLVFRRRLLDENGELVARLTFNLRYGTDAAGEREAVLMLFVRGHPQVPTIEGCLDMIDAEREVIVQTFTDLTSNPAHKLWGRRG